MEKQEKQEKQDNYLAPIIRERERVTRLLVNYGFTPEDLAFTGKKHGRQPSWQARHVIVWSMCKAATRHGLGIQEVARATGTTYAACLNNYYEVTQALKGTNYPMINRLVTLVDKDKARR